MTISLGYREPDRLEYTLSTLLSEVMEEKKLSIFAAGAVIVLMSVHILFWIDILKELLEKCRNE